MMGVQKAPARPFHDFDPEVHMPTDHMLREIDRFLDLGSIRQQLKPFWSYLARPSVDPELFLRMLMNGSLQAIRPEPRSSEPVPLSCRSGC